VGRDRAGAPDLGGTDDDHTAAVAAHQVDVRIGFECEAHGQYDTGIVNELVFVLTDFSAPEDDAGGRSRMPLLEMLLSRANPAAIDCDWRAWLAARAAPAPLWEFSLAAIVRAAFRGVNTKPESTGYWLATPAHFFAGLDSVHVHPAGLLDLAPSEQEALIVDFARVFFDSPWRLEVLGRRELLLAGPHIEADCADPSLYKGADPRLGLPRGPAAGTLQRLGSEIEMWLYEHPINRARIVRGELPVTALWLWGARAPQIPKSPVGALLTNAALYGRDAYAEALWRLQGREASGLSAALELINAVPMQLPSDTVVLIEGLSELEQHWLPGALQGVRKRRLSVLRLVAGARVFSMSTLNLSRFWRQPAPWWEALA
jgi:hypothetical protein